MFLTCTQRHQSVAILSNVPYYNTIFYRTSQIFQCCNSGYLIAYGPSLSRLVHYSLDSDTCRIDRLEVRIETMSVCFVGRLLRSKGQFLKNLQGDSLSPFLS